MKQKLHSLLLMVVLLSWSMVIAASDFDDGILKYTITSPENLEVQCDGFTDAHINDESVVIPETVNYNNATYSVVSIRVGYYAGLGNEVRKITLPSSLKKIGDFAFYNCKKIEEVIIPKNVTSIGEYAFYQCQSLESVEIPSSVTSIGNYAFTGCTDLASLELSYGITRIGTDAFKNCTSLESIEIPNSVKELRAGCLSYCSSLKNIVLSTSIDVIYPYLFAGCSALKSIEIPASVQIIWASVFYKCTNLKNIICNSTKAPTFVQITNVSGPCRETLCEPTLAPQITLVTPKGAVGYAEAPWSYFKAPEALRLTDVNASLDAGAYPIGSLTYSRTNMTSGSYATFCLPFGTNLSEVSDAFENVYTANQTALYKPDGKLILLLQKIDKDASISAGQPFVAKLKGNVTEVTFSNNKLMTVDSDIMQNGTPTPLHVFDWDGTSGLLTENTDIKVSYGGALTTMTGVGSEYETFNSNGTFGPTKGGQVKAFRAYVLKEDAVTQGRVKSISFGIEGNDGTTNIETIVDSPEKNTDKMVYSIDGRLVNTTSSVIGLPSGIYIKNHQKIYVK